MTSIADFYQREELVGLAAELAEQYSGFDSTSVQITKTNRIKLFLHELQQFFIADLVQHLIFIREKNLLQPQQRLYIIVLVDVRRSAKLLYNLYTKSSHRGDVHEKRNGRRNGKLVTGCVGAAADRRII